VVSRTQPKLGGNYTNPHYDPITGITNFQVFVGWHLLGTYDSDAEAVYALREAMSPDYDRVVSFEKTHA